MRKLIHLVSAVTFVSVSLMTFGSGVFAAEKAQLTTAPNVPAPLKRSKPARVVVNFEAKEYVGELADGVKYKFWSFNGTVPGPMVRVRQGDTVEFHLSNAASSQFPHNIDIHAVNRCCGNFAFVGRFVATFRSMERICCSVITLTAVCDLNGTEPV